MLPFGWQLALGRLLGRLFYYALPSRRHVAVDNISRCLPHLSKAERQEILDKHFASLGMSVFETLMTWWGNHKKICNNYTVTGEENLRAAETLGKGVILLVPHFTHIDISAVFLQQVTQFRSVYRPMNNPFLEELTLRGRNRASSGVIPKSNIREMIKALKQGNTVTFLPDQNFRKKHSELIPFFGIPAPTNIATSRIAKVSGAPVVALFIRRRGETYHLQFSPALDDFPSNDAVNDSTRIHQLIEQEIIANPSQYLWVHRRFKQ